jgi:tellurite resistance protein
MPSTETNYLKFFPITLFATVMGLTGLAIVLMKVAHLFHFSPLYGKYLAYTVTAWFLFILFVYLIKLIRYPEEVSKEFHHPVRMNFFPAISISMLLISIVFMPINMNIAKVAWWIGTPLHLIFLLRSLSAWFHKEFEIHTINPAWFIPVVGPILVPVAGAKIANIEISWFFFSIGIVYAIALFAILLNRIIFHHPIPGKLIPTLFILIAPPAVGFIAYVKMTGSLDSFARILYYFGLFTFLMLLTMINRFLKLPFFISWWAYTFPLDALTLSTVLIYEKTHIALFKTLTGVFFVITILVIIIVFIKTLQSAAKNEICVPE